MLRSGAYTENGKVLDRGGSRVDGHKMQIANTDAEVEIDCAHLGHLNLCVFILAQKQGIQVKLWIAQAFILRLHLRRKTNTECWLETIKSRQGARPNGDESRFETLGIGKSRDVGAR